MTLTPPQYDGCSVMQLILRESLRADDEEAGGKKEEWFQCIGQQWR